MSVVDDPGIFCGVRRLGHAALLFVLLLSMPSEHVACGSLKRIVFVSSMHIAYPHLADTCYDVSLDMIVHAGFE